MTFTESLRNCLTIKYCSTRGRASRSEYWWFILFSLVVGSVLENLSDGDGALSLVAGLASLFLIIPHICVTSRRLHDIGWSGWWQLLPLALIFGGALSVLFDGGILLLVGIAGGMGFGLYFGLRKGTAPGEPNPYGGAPDSFVMPQRSSGSAPSQVEDFVIEDEEATAATCPKCGRAFAVGDRFCGGCGHPFPAEPRCPSCGRELTGGDQFCTSCGARLKNGI